MAENWSVEEVEAAVADYLSMLELELRALGSIKPNTGNT